MRRAHWLVALCIVVSMAHIASATKEVRLAGRAGAESTAPQETRVVVVTELGDIDIAVDAERAPNTAANFFRYVDGRFFDGGTFFRTVTLDNQPDDKVRIEVIQGGVNPAREKEQFPSIPLERTRDTGMRHVDGAVSMARSGPDSARASFFICIGDQPELDFGGARNPDGQGFAAFGHVVRGMDVVRRIQKSPAQAQQLRPPIRIVRVTRAKSDALDR